MDASSSSGAGMCDGSVQLLQAADRQGKPRPRPRSARYGSSCGLCVDGRRVTAAPFALCPRFHLLAVGMASSATPRGDAEEAGASRVDVLRLLRPTGDHDLGRTLQVDCVLRAPGLRRVAWSSTPTKRDDSETPFTPIEQDIYPVGLLAGGFNDGAVRIWSPEPAMFCDFRKSSIMAKPKAELMLNEDPVEYQKEKAQISATVSEMYSDIHEDTIRWTYSQEKDYFQIKEEEENMDWHMVDNDAESSGWEIIPKEEPVAYHHRKTQMKLVTETHDLHGPVLGLSFNELHPYWIGIAALGESISVHDLHHPLQLSRKKCECGEACFYDSPPRPLLVPAPAPLLQNRFSIATPAPRAASARRASDVERRVDEADGTTEVACGRHATGGRWWPAAGDGELDVACDLVLFSSAWETTRAQQIDGSEA